MQGNEVNRLLSDQAFGITNGTVNGSLANTTHINGIVRGTIAGMVDVGTYIRRSQHCSFAVPSRGHSDAAGYQPA